MAWRAREEGVSLDETHEPRRYDAYATPGIPDDTLVGGNPLAGVSSALTLTLTLTLIGIHWQVSLVP